MNYESNEEGTQCHPETTVLEKIKMFKTHRFEELWNNEGDGSGKKLTIIRGLTEIKKEEGDLDVDPLYNLGDKLVVGDIVPNETYAFIYRRHVSSTISPFKLPYSYNLIWDSSGARNKNPKQGAKN